MAETLSVTDMLPNKFEPKRKFRWVFAIEGIDAFLMKTAARPTINTAAQEISFMNYPYLGPNFLKLGLMDFTSKSDSPSINSIFFIFIM